LRSIALGALLLASWGGLALFRESTAVDVGDVLLAHSKFENTSQSASVPRRVVTASLLVEDLLLGILPEERWAGISFVVDWSSSTPASTLFSKKIPRVNGNAESILGARPDLVILSDFNQFSTIAQLSEAEVPVYRVKSPRDFDELFETWQELGERVGWAEVTRDRMAPYQARVRALRGSSPPLRVLLLQGRFSYGPGSLHDACLHHVGLQNIVTDRARGTTPELGTEELATLQPDLVFYAASVESPREVVGGAIPTELPYRDFPASSAPHVYLFPEALLGSISQHVIEACEAYQSLAKALPARQNHPQAQAVK
jgi:ABC-type Fe3+-hydroxamate transport system substrate-binding protein